MKICKIKNRMAIPYALAAVVLLALPAVNSAQLRLPRASPKASVSQTIGVTDISITYNRPAVKGRKIWGEVNTQISGESTLDDASKRPADAPLVPFGHVWRTGANEATQISFSDDVLVNGKPLAAGTYSLHTIPNRDQWTIIFNSVANQWGSFNYDPKNDALRITAKPLAAADNQEYLEFRLEPKTESSVVATIAWEKIRVPFTIEVPNQNALVLSKAEKAVAEAKPNDWNTPFAAANFAKQQKDTAKAELWYSKALAAIDSVIAANASYENLVRKVNILFAAGRRKEAFEAAAKALEKGKQQKADTTALEKRLEQEKQKGDN
jgi:hypothetical protein